MPRLPPVTTARLPVSCRSILVPSACGCTRWIPLAPGPAGPGTSGSLSRLQVGVLRFIGDQDPLQQAREVTVVAHRVVHGSPIVPERDGAGPPAEAHLELRLAVLVVRDGQELPALGPVEADDPGVLGEVHPEDLPAGLAVGADDRVSHDRVVMTGAGQRRPVIMGYVEAVEALLDVVGERVVGQPGVDP